MSSQKPLDLGPEPYSQELCLARSCRGVGGASVSYDVYLDKDVRGLVVDLHIYPKRQGYQYRDGPSYIRRLTVGNEAELRLAYSQLGEEIAVAFAGYDPGDNTPIDPEVIVESLVTRVDPYDVMAKQLLKHIQQS